MRRINLRHSIAIVLSAFILCAVGYFLFQKAQLRPAEYTVKRIIKYSFTVNNPANEFLKQAEFWTYTPVQITSSQKVVGVKASHPPRPLLDNYGNTRQYFTINALPPFGSQIVNITVELELSDKPNLIAEEFESQYLKPEKFVESDSSEILSLANNLKGKNELETVKNIYTWIVDNIEDAGFVERDHGALYTLDKKQGDCTEFTHLFVALSRANGIPSRGMAGFVHSENAVLKPGDYHNWAEVFIDGAWRVVDAQKKTFMENQSHYVAMRILGENPSESEIGVQSFFSNNSTINIRMN
jgi:transglutaminase-like putative cysteine protease